MPQPQLQCCCQVLVLQHRGQQLSKEAITTHCHDAIKGLQLLKAQTSDILLCMPLQQQENRASAVSTSKAHVSHCPHFDSQEAEHNAHSMLHEAL